MRFTIRDVLLVTTIFALSIGWWLDRSRLQDELVKTQEDVTAAREGARELMKDMDAIHPGWRGAKWRKPPEEAEWFKGTPGKWK